ncbi:hypothetical protein C346_04795 [Cryptococcus neoformans D17-1]|nr:hypothetical protein C346_04795 [Cryptococcus neoformans var. grubii D17-1]
MGLPSEGSCLVADCIWRHCWGRRRSNMGCSRGYHDVISIRKG